jgi:hypothetical protein
LIPNRCREVHTSPVDRPSVPGWFAEVVIMARHLATKGLLDAFAHQVRLVRGQFGCYELIDLLARLLGYAISGERTLADFFERLAPFGPAFMALDAACQPSSSLQLEPVPGWCGSSLRANLSQALRARQLCRRLDPIATNLKHFALPPEVALVRLDGHYGDAAVTGSTNCSSPRWVRTSSCQWVWNLRLSLGKLMHAFTVLLDGKLRCPAGASLCFG